MGDLLSFVRQMKQSELRGGSGVLVAASAAEIEGLSAALTVAALPAASVLALGSDQPLPHSALGGISLLIVEVDPASATSMMRLARVRDEHPGLLVVAAIRDATVSLVRTLVHQGVVDVVALPFDHDEVRQVALDALARREGAQPQKVSTAPLVSVVRSIGGCGATSIATHLAAALGAQGFGKGGALLADLDVQCGTVTDYLGLTPKGRLTDLLEAEGRLDEELLRSVVIAASDQLSVIAAPDTILPLEQIDTDQMLKVVELLRNQYGVVVLDLPADWTNWTLSAAAASDIILMVVELTLPSLRQAKRRLDLFRSVGIEDRAIGIVINRAEKRLFGTIGVADVSKTLGCTVMGSIGLDHPLVSTAQNQGQLVGAIRRKSRFGADIEKLAEQLRAGPLAGSA